MPCVDLPEYTQILYPDENGQYLPIPYTLRDVMGSLSGGGKAPSHVIRQRGPFQDGTTPLDMRWDGRTVELSLSKTWRTRTDYWDRRWMLMDMLRPNRAFDPSRSAPQPLILRHWLPGGKIQRGVDLRLTNASAFVQAYSGRFVHWGLQPGEQFTITGSTGDDGTYTILNVPNDFTVQLDTAMTATEADVHYTYRRGQSYRDLFMLLDDGPSYGEPAQVLPQGIDDAITLTADDPFWYGPPQEQSWNLAEAFGDLVMDLKGAWMGATPGVGRWLFYPSFVGESVSVVYWGHEGALPVIEITGPATNPSINNATLGITLTMDYEVAAGEVVTIDVLNLTVTNNFGDNLFAFLNGDVANFIISPNPQAPLRINDINLSFSEGQGGLSEGKILWRNRYVSL